MITREQQKKLTTLKKKIVKRKKEGYLVSFREAIDELFSYYPYQIVTPITNFSIHKSIDAKIAKTFTLTQVTKKFGRRIVGSKIKPTVTYT